MAIKVFLHNINRAFYRNNPASLFEIELNYSICMSSGLPPDNDPQTEEGSMILQFPITSSPNEVYAMAWSRVLEICATKGWETPAKADVYCWLPLDFSQILPE